MAQVPYSGVPEVAPQMDATPRVSGDVPAAAFGAQSAQGLGQMGKGFERAGGELWARATALQQLDQQMSALNANADAADKISDEYAKFSTLEGKAAMAELPNFKKRVQEIHAQIGEGLGSDYARKLYQQESRAMQTRVYFSAAKHAGDQFKHYMVGSSQASIESARRIAGTMPDDDNAYDASLKTNEREAKAMGQLRGWSEEQTQNFLGKSNSETVVARTQALAERDPIAAQKVLDAAIKKGIIAGDDAGKMGHYIRSQKNNVMARVESAKFMNGEASTVGSGIVNIEAAAKSRAEQLAPGDVEFAEIFTNKVRIQHSHDQQMARQDEYDRQNTMLEAIGPGPDGKLPTSVDEMGPDAREAYMNADVKHRRQIDKILMQNTRNGYSETPENTRQYQKLMGIANDPLRSPEATKELLDTDVTNLEMPWRWKQDIAKVRMAVFKNTQRNPALGHAMQLLAPMLDAAGVSKKSKDDWYVFQGALHLMMQDKLQDGKPMNDDDIKKMGATLLRQTTRPGSVFGSLWPTKEEAFRNPVPEADKKQIIEAYKRNTGVEPKDREIQSIYAAKQAREFNQYYGKKRAQEADAPTVPRSQ